MARIERADRLGDLRVGVLDRVCLVEHERCSGIAASSLAIARDEWYVVTITSCVAQRAEPLVTIRPVVHGDAQRRREPLEFALPVPDEARRRDDHRGPVEPAVSRSVSTCAIVCSVLPRPMSSASTPPAPCARRCWSHATPSR